MEIAIPGKIVVLDYGEVISLVPGGPDRDLLLALAACDEDEFWTAYWRHRDALDQGVIGVKQYWDRIGRDLVADWDTATIHQLWLADFRGWLAIDNETLQVLIDLQGGDTRMALLSNAGRDFASYYRHGMLGDFFERVFVSCEIGVLKPDRAIFHAMMEGLGVRPEEVLFVDDREVNVRSAEALGITSHLFAGAAGLRTFLEQVAGSTEPTSHPGSPDVVAI